MLNAIFNSETTGEDLDREAGQVFDIRMKAHEIKPDNVKKIRFEALANFVDQTPKHN